MCISTVASECLDLCISTSLFPEYSGFFTCKTHCYSGVWSLSRGTFSFGEELIWKILGIQRIYKECAVTDTNIFLSNLDFLPKLTHILYPSSVLFAQLDVHRVQFSLQLPLHANIIAVHMGNWSAWSSICMHLFIYSVWQFLKWFCSLIILSCIFSFCLCNKTKSWASVRMLCLECSKAEIQI